MPDTRVDPHLGTVVHVVASRQSRPNLPADGCPFCVGGLEAPEPYLAKSFPNRWPALGEGKCEVVLYTPDHDATFHSLGTEGVRRVIDLWASRTAALASSDGVECVLVFENRGAEVGATIAHPHGQIYAFEKTPSRIARRFAAGWAPDDDPGARSVIKAPGAVAYAQHASVFPVSLIVAPAERAPDLDSLGGGARDALAGVLVDLFARLDRLYDEPLPYMMWVNQAPRGAVDGWMSIEIVSPWRARGVARYIAAAEVAGEEYFNPVDPVDVAGRLRDLAR